MDALLIALSLLSPVEAGKARTLDKDYLGSVAALKPVKPTRATYNEYCYLMAVNHFALNQKAEAERWIAAFQASYEPKTERHTALIALMARDIETWKAGDIGDVERDMRVSTDRLDTGRPGPTTQRVQGEIVAKLDKLIKDAEDKANGGGKGGGKDQKPGEQDGQQAEGPAAPKPADDSKVMGGKDGQGKVDEKVLRKHAENWGTMPKEARQAVIDQITREVSPKYRQTIEEYFKHLNRLHPERGQ